MGLLWARPSPPLTALGGGYCYPRTAEEKVLTEWPEDLSRSLKSRGGASPATSLGQSWKPSFSTLDSAWLSLSPKPLRGVGNSPFRMTGSGSQLLSFHPTPPTLRHTAPAMSSLFWNVQACSCLKAFALPECFAPDLCPAGSSLVQRSQPFVTSSEKPSLTARERCAARPGC